MACEECASIQVFCSKAIRPKTHRQQPLGGSVCMYVSVGVGVDVEGWSNRNEK